MFGNTPTQLAWNGQGVAIQKTCFCVEMKMIPRSTQKNHGYDHHSMGWEWGWGINLQITFIKNWMKHPDQHRKVMLANNPPYEECGQSLLKL